MPGNTNGLALASWVRNERPKIKTMLIYDGGAAFTACPGKLLNKANTGGAPSSSARSIGSHLADELADGGGKRTLAIAVLLPCLALAEQGGDRLHGEALGIEPRAHLLPVQRH